MATQTTATQRTAKANGVTEPSHPVTDQLKETLHSSVDKLADSAGVAEENIRQTASKSAENMSVIKQMAASAPIDRANVDRIKDAIKRGEYPIDIDRISDALLEAYKQMKS